MTKLSENMQSDDVGMKVAIPLVQTVFMPRKATGVQAINEIKTVVYMESLRNFGDEQWLQGYYEIDVLYTGLNGKNCRHRVMMPLKEQIQLPAENLAASDMYYNISEPRLEVLAPLVLEFTGRLQAEILDVARAAEPMPQVAVQDAVIDVEALRRKTLDRLQRENAVDSMFTTPKILIAKADPKMDLQLPEIFADTKVKAGEVTDFDASIGAETMGNLPRKSLVDLVDAEAAELKKVEFVKNEVADLEVEDSCEICEDVQNIVTNVVDTAEQVSENVGIVVDKIGESVGLVVDTAKDTVLNTGKVVSDTVDALVNCVEDALDKDEVLPEVDGDVSDEILPEVDGDVSDEILPEVDGDVGDEVLPEVDGDVGDEVLPEIDGDVGEEVLPEVDGDVGDEVLPEIDGDVGEEVLPEVDGDVGDGEILPVVGMRTRIGMQESRPVNMFAVPQKSSYKLKYYVVQDGDEPLAIALKHNVSLDNLLSKNSLRDGELEAGRVLRIPS